MQNDQFPSRTKEKALKFNEKISLPGINNQKLFIQYFQIEIFVHSQNIRSDIFKTLTRFISV